MGLADPPPAAATAAATPVPPSPPAPASAPAGLSPSALRQIEALQNAKLTRSPAQQKMDSNLIDADKASRGESTAPGVALVAPGLERDGAGRVLVDLEARVTPELLRALESLGARVVNHFVNFDAIRAWLPLASIESIAGRPDVKFVRQAVKAATNTGSVNSEGDVAHRANTARTTFGVNGSGVKVAVLSDSVDFLAASQASADLGPVTVLPGQSGVPGSGEGTAMLEIVHDLAPGAELFYATAFNGPASFAQNILDLRNRYACDIIIDDVGYFNESPFQDGVIARAVNQVTADGALFFSSAGNAGNKSDNQSGTWEGDFVDGGTFTTGGQTAGRIHNFGGVTDNRVVSGGSSRHVDLFWADPLGAAANDYDVYVLDAAGANVVAKSDSTQAGQGDPYEFVDKLEIGQRIVVVKFKGDARYLYLGTGRGRLAVSTPGNTRGHNSAVDAFCVAAVDANTSFPDPFTGNAKNPVEDFSSDGPRRVFFSADGTAITPGNFSATGGAIRQKPDIAAADGVVTTLPGDSGLNPFFGTSAAAPHAGAIAALVKSYNRALSPAQIRSILTGTALDIESPGTDRDCGAGLVMALAALQSVAGAVAPTLTALNPATGPVGTAVTLTGTRFTGATSVKFNGVAAQFQVDDSTHITTTVPAGAATGRVTVTTPGGTATSAVNFVIVNTPSITGFTPASGAPGTPVALTGANFTGASRVEFAGINAPIFTVDSSTRITVTVPAGATTGRISVTTPAGTGSSTANFVITVQPIIAGFSPVTGAVGTVVVLDGANLTGASAVRFGGVNAPVFTVNSAARITVTVPAGAVTGPISVTNPNGTASSGAVFTVVGAPSIGAVTPAQGSVGAAVVIAGTSFTGATFVRFNGVPAVFAVNSPTEISTAVPAGATTGPVSVTTPGGTATSATAFTVLNPAGNDSFANATVLTGAAGTLANNSAAATKEVNEPAHAGNEGGKSLWYRWTAPAAGTVQFDTTGSGFDTLLAVYTGTALGALTTVAANDDNATSRQSTVTIVAVAGTTYRIAVDGYRSPGGTAASAAAGDIVLRWAGNAAAPAITGFNPASGPAGSLVVVDGANIVGVTAVSFNDVAAAFTINSATRLTATVPANAGSGPIRVTGPGGTATSAATFNATTAPANDRFANARTLTGASGTTTGSNTDATREAGEPNHAGNSGGSSVWFSWVAPAAGNFTFETTGSDFDTLLAVYTGANVSALTPLASNDDAAPGTISRVTFPAVAGITYRLAIDGFNGASGSWILRWSSEQNPPAITSFTPTTGSIGSTVILRGANFSGAIAVRFNGVSATFTVDSAAQITAVVPLGANSGPISVTTPNGTASSPTAFAVGTGPRNDQFASAQLLTGPAVVVAGSTVEASKETGEPNHASNSGGRSIWYRWTAPANGTWAIDTAGSRFDTTLGVYTGASVNTLAVVASNDDARDDRTSRAYLSATAGSTYFIAIDGYNGDNGDVTLKVVPSVAPQTLYATGFEASQGFAAGQPLVGQGGWQGSGSGGNAVWAGLWTGSPQQAVLGVNAPLPGDELTLVWWPANHTPAVATRPIVRFKVDLSIVDSSNGSYDDFFWSAYNQAGDWLFSLNFDNADLGVYTLLNDGSGFARTPVSFVNESIDELNVIMDFGRNRWRATLNGESLGPELPISAAPGPALNLGDIDAAWGLKNPFSAGDNAMVFDAYTLTAEAGGQPVIAAPPASQSIVAGATLILSVAADGAEPLQFQWSRNGVPIPAATNAILESVGVNTGQAGTYAVTVSNPLGTTTASAVVTVVQPARAVLSQARILPDGQWQFTITGTTGARYTVEYSANLIDWQELTTVLIQGGNAVVTDPLAGGAARRFYRGRTAF